MARLRGMELIEAVRLFLVESAAHPRLMRLVRFTHDEYMAGRAVPWETLRMLIDEASGAGVLAAVRERNPATWDEAFTTLLLELDRVSADPVREPKSSYRLQPARSA
jgi:hypothetical protein